MKTHSAGTSVSKRNIRKPALRLSRDPESASNTSVRLIPGGPSCKPTLYRIVTTARDGRSADDFRSSGEDGCSGSRGRPNRPDAGARSALTRARCHGGGQTSGGAEHLKGGGCLPGYAR